MELVADSKDVLPIGMIAKMERYIEEGEPMGDFLTAVFANNLRHALFGADAENLKLIGYYVHYVYWHTPAPCNGSYEIVKAWIDKGGNRGKIDG